MRLHFNLRQRSLSRCPFSTCRWEKLIGPSEGEGVPRVCSRRTTPWCRGARGGSTSSRGNERILPAIHTACSGGEASRTTAGRYRWSTIVQASVARKKRSVLRGNAAPQSRVPISEAHCAACVNVKCCVTITIPNSVDDRCNALRLLHPTFFCLIVPRIASCLPRGSICLKSRMGIGSQGNAPPRHSREGGNDGISTPANLSNACQFAQSHSGQRRIARGARPQFGSAETPRSESAAIPFDNRPVGRTYPTTSA